MSANMSVSEMRDRASAFRNQAEAIEAVADKVEQELASLNGLLNGSTSSNGHVAKRVAKATGSGRPGRPKGSKNKPKDGTVSKATGSGRPGRPKGSKNKPKDGTSVAKRPAKVKTAATEVKPRKKRENTISAVIHKVLKEKKGGIDLPGLTESCLKHDVKSNAEDFENVVYQTVNRLVKKEHTVEFNKADRKYRLVKAA